MKRLLSTLIILLALTMTASAVCEDSFAYRAALEVEEAAERARAAGKAMIGAFASVTVAGDAVTENVFADAQLTLVNFWATFCGPCIEEMPGLAAIANDPPDGVQVLGVVIDWPGNEADGARILSATGADAYAHILPSGALDGLVGSLVGVPTTYFVDAAGALVGEPVLGALGEAEFRDELAARLAEVG